MNENFSVTLPHVRIDNFSSWFFRICSDWYVYSIILLKFTTSLTEWLSQNEYFLTKPNETVRTEWVDRLLWSCILWCGYYFTSFTSVLDGGWSRIWSDTWYNLKYSRPKYVTTLPDVTWRKQRKYVLCDEKYNNSMILLPIKRIKIW